ncbi:MAG: acetylglutamate kinase [Planctomycetes bacterium]|nr:acetylglutamate kinase [Planctomycetota bacterium]
MQLPANLKALRTAAPYIRAYKGRVFVVKLSGRLCEPGAVLDNLVEQLALLHQVGIQLVIVHGGAAQANALSERLGNKPDIFAGRRITDDATLEVAKMAFAGTVSTNLSAAFRRAAVPAVGLSGVDAGLLTARRRPPQRATDPASGETREIDFGHVGEIISVCVDPLDHFLTAGYVPLICSLAADNAGQVMNVNADTVAARIAVAIRAAKYILATDVDGVLRDPVDPATLQSYLGVSQLDELIDAGVIGGGMLPKLAACKDALRGGVPRVHIINGTVPDTILGEVFTNEGCGTLLVEKRENAEVPAKPLPVTS